MVIDKYWEDIKLWLGRSKDEEQIRAVQWELHHRDEYSEDEKLRKVITMLENNLDQ